MKLGNIFRGPKWPRDAAEFIATHFADKSVTEFFDEPRFERFLYLAKTETWVEAVTLCPKTRASAEIVPPLTSSSHGDCRAPPNRHR